MEERKNHGGKAGRRTWGVPEAARCAGVWLATHERDLELPKDSRKTVLPYSAQACFFVVPSTPSCAGRLDNQRIPRRHADIFAYPPKIGHGPEVLEALLLHEETSVSPTSSPAVTYLTASSRGTATKQGCASAFSTCHWCSSSTSAAAAAAAKEEKEQEKSK